MQFLITYHNQGRGKPIGNPTENGEEEMEMLIAAIPIILIKEEIKIEIFDDLTRREIWKARVSEIIERIKRKAIELWERYMR